jgi:hypothetical protein
MEIIGKENICFLNNFFQGSVTNDRLKVELQAVCIGGHCIKALSFFPPSFFVSLSLLS